MEEVFVNFFGILFDFFLDGRIMLFDIFFENIFLFILRKKSNADGVVDVEIKDGSVGTGVEMTGWIFFFLFSGYLRVFFTFRINSANYLFFCNNEHLFSCGRC